MYTGNLNEGHFSFLLDLQLSRLTSLTAVHGQFLLTCHFKNNWICFHNLPPRENDVQNVRSCVNLTASREKYSKSSAPMSQCFFFFPKHSLREAISKSTPLVFGSVLAELTLE